MSTELRHRRGTTVQHSTFAGAVGEFTMDTDKSTAVVHDGATLGGRALSREDATVIAATKAAPVDADVLGLQDSGAGWVRKKLSWANLKTALFSGNLAFTGTGNRITGDFSNATIANRVAFQTSTANSITSVAALPNGSGNTAQWTLYNSPDVNNASLFDMLVGPTEARFRALGIGTGVNLPMTFNTGGSERVRIDTSGCIGVKVVPNTNWATSQAVIELKNNHAIYEAAGTNLIIAANLYQDAGAATKYATTNYAAQINVAKTTGFVTLATYPLGAANATVVTAAATWVVDQNNCTMITANGGLGYGTGAGGTVTQATSKGTAVTLNKPTGKITMTGDAMASSGAVTFLFNNTLIGLNDTVVVTPDGTSMVTRGSYQVTCLDVGSGNCVIRVVNVSGGSLSETLKINFAIIKGATS